MQSMRRADDTHNVRMTIWMLGHSTRSIDAFLGLVTSQHIDRLIDIRRLPRSRRHPQFDHVALARSLADVGIEYTHAPNLGGRRRPAADSANTAWQNDAFRGYADHMQTEVFARAIDDLVKRAETERLALMCAEAVPWRCHRQLVADALVARGVEVCEIESESRIRPHAMTGWARVEGQAVTYPGVA